MRYLITNNPKTPNFEGYQKLPSQASIDLVNTLFKGDIAFDIESTNLDCYSAKPLIYVLGDKENQVAFEHNFCNKEDMIEVIKVLETKRTIGHNIKFDIKFIYVNEGILLRKLYDTMIAEQRLYQKLGIRMGLDHLNVRYRDVELNDMDKAIRMEFIGVDPKYFKLEKKHLDYAIGDIKHLHFIKEKQDERMYKNNLYNLIYKIEFPLISILAKAEVTGFNFDLKKWNFLAQQNLDNKLITEQKLDVIFRELRDNTDLNQEERLKCTGGKYDHKRVLSPLYKQFNNDGTPKGTDLFGKPITQIKQVTGTKKNIEFYPKDIKYTADQITEIFAHLKEELPTKFGEYEIPQLNSKGKIDKSYVSFQTGKEPLTKYMLNYSTSRMIPFINHILQQRTLNTRINNFGVKYESKINKITGKIHTIYRQARADTGRLQSGGGKGEPDKPNFQNIPADKEMRSCFIAKEGRKIITTDYSGAELIVMCSHSQDMKLLEISKGDMHSYIATKCWKAVYKYRANTFRKEYESRNSVIERGELERLIAKYDDLANNFFVDKSPEKKHLRTGFKPVTFGVIYGLRHKALADNLSIEEEEAKVIIRVIEQTFPKVIRFVKDMAIFAEQNGYLILNNRTKSRVYFPNIIKHLKGEYSMDYHFKEIMKDANEARNISIQGTQADAIKEATVKLQEFIDNRNIDAIQLNWVHDEIIVDISNTDLYKEYIVNGTTYNNFAEVKEYILTDTFNKYLNNVKIKVDYSIEQFWVK